MFHKLNKGQNSNVYVACNINFENLREISLL